LSSDFRIRKEGLRNHLIFLGEMPIITFVDITTYSKEVKMR
jgi:hypothetical protein